MREPAGVAFGRSMLMAAALRLVGAFADASEPLLILGEPGTGKSTIAQMIHERGRPRGPFVRYSIPATSDTLQHDALLGHARGAFTGAVTDRRGLVEDAHHGTLFIDELIHAPAGLLGLLLSLLEDPEIRRAGESQRRMLNVRIIAATNADLERMATEGRFPPDLLDRFRPFVIEVPPLRDRREEILPLFRSTLERARARMAPEGPVAAEPIPIHPDVVQLLEAAPWPGNLRQVVKEAVYVAHFGRGTREVRPEHLSTRVIAEAEAALTGERLETALARARRRFGLQALLDLEGGNIGAVAAQLGVSRRHAYRLAANPRAEGMAPRRGRPRKGA